MHNLKDPTGKVRMVDLFELMAYGDMALKIADGGVLLTYIERTEKTEEDGEAVERCIMAERIFSDVDSLVTFIRTYVLGKFEKVADDVERNMKRRGKN